MEKSTFHCSEARAASAWQTGSPAANWSRRAANFSGSGWIWNHGTTTGTTLSIGGNALS